MSRRKGIAGLWRHETTNQFRVSINGRDHYPVLYRGPESQAEHRRRAPAERQACVRVCSDLTVAELVVHFPAFTKKAKNSCFWF